MDLRYMPQSGISEEKTGCEEKRMAGRRNYKFTRKTQSKKGMISLAMAAVSIGVFFGAAVTSFRQGGQGSMYLGSAGICSMLLAFTSFVLAIFSLREENSYRLFPYLATAFSFAASGIWLAVYIVGIMV